MIKIKYISIKALDRNQVDFNQKQLPPRTWQGGHGCAGHGTTGAPPSASESSAGEVWWHRRDLPRGVVRLWPRALLVSVRRAGLNCSLVARVRNIEGVDHAAAPRPGALLGILNSVRRVEERHSLRGRCGRNLDLRAGSLSFRQISRESAERCGGRRRAGAASTRCARLRPLSGQVGRCGAPACVARV